MSWEIITWFWHAYIYIPMLIKNFYWGWMYDIPPLCLILAKVTVHCKIIVSQHPFWWKIIDTRHKPGHTIIVILYIEVIIYNYIIFCFMKLELSYHTSLMSLPKWSVSRTARRSSCSSLVFTSISVRRLELFISSAHRAMQSYASCTLCTYSSFRQLRNKFYNTTS